MRSSRSVGNKISTRTASAVVAILCLAGFAGTGVASAAGGTWNEVALNSSTPATLAGTLTLSPFNGWSSAPGSTSCPVSSGSWIDGSPLAGSALNGATAGQARFLGNYTRRTCSNGRVFSMALELTPAGGPSAWTATVRNTWGLGVTLQSPFAAAYQPTYNQLAGFSVPFTNGSGGSSSTVTFSNTRIGTDAAGNALYAWGTLALTRNAGGTLTVS